MGLLSYSNIRSFRYISLISHLPIERDLQHESLIYPIECENDGVKDVIDRLKQQHEQSGKLPWMLRIRYTFGGALFSLALAILFTALWGINQGERWLWWTFLGGGLSGFVAVFSVHLMIGYSDFWHLLPAYFAFVIYVIGLVLLYPYLVSPRHLSSGT